MIRLGASSTGVALAAVLLVPGPAARIVAVAFLVAGLALLAAGREPWPTCCGHCHVHEQEPADDADRR